MPDEPKGKLLWDVVALRLAAQSANQSALTGRAKDLLGTATIATTITGVILNDKLFEVVKDDAPIWWTGGAGVALVVLVASGILAIWPREYSFAPNAEDFQRVMETYPSATVDALYRATALGYLVAPPRGKSQLAKNYGLLKNLERFVRVEAVALAALAGLAFALAFVIDAGPVS